MSKRKIKLDRLIIVLAVAAIILFLIYFVISSIISAIASLFAKEVDVIEDLRVKENYDELLPAVPVIEPETPEIYQQLPLEYSESTTLTSELQSDYGILFCVDNRQVLASKSSEVKLYPASMTKVMTLIVAVENISDLNDTVKMSFEVIDPLYLQGASVTGFKSGDIVTLEDLLYGIVLPSGADATVTVAEYVSGSEEEFVKLMNDKAAELGLKNTHFTNTSGLHNNDHYTTAHDMAIILDYAIHNDTCKKILSTLKYVTKSHTTDANGISKSIEFYSTMFKSVARNQIEGMTICGGKTGYTSEALYCLASFAEKNGKTYISVTAHAPMGHMGTVWANTVSDITKLYTEYTY